jgi:hypothetical protein
MTLLASGSLSLLGTAGINRNISQEVDRNSVSPKQFTTVSSHAIPSYLPVSMSNYYSYTQPYINFGTVSYDVNNASQIDANRSVDMYGKSAQWTIVVYGYLYCLGTSPVGNLWYRRSGGAWVKFLELLTTGSNYIYYSIDMYYSETLDVRINIYNNASLQGIINLVSVSEPSTTRVPYVGTTNTWTVSL